MADWINKWDTMRALQAINPVAKLMDGDLVIKISEVENVLENMPSVQQEIIRCKDCKYYKFGICMKIGANKSFYGFCDWAERGEQNE